MVGHSCHLNSQRPKARGWRAGSGVKSTGCPSRGPVFKPQYTHGSSQLSVTPVPGTLSKTLTPTCKQNTSAHKMKIIKKET